MRFSQTIRNEKGALSYIVAVVFVSLLTVIGISMFLLQRNSSIGTKREELSSKSLYIAEAGVNNYLWHMNQDDDYYQTQTHPGQSSWQTYKDGEYFLEVEQRTDAPGVYITSTGRVKISGSSNYKERTIKATIQKRSFTNYLYFTDHETVEGSGSSIWFITGDVIHGPLHSNDYLRIDGNPVFEGPVTTARTIIMAGGSDPDFQQGYRENVEPLELPSSNSQLKTWAQNGGYYYYGKTNIVMSGSGTLSITNNNGQSTGPTGIGVSLPGNGVIYVDGQIGTKWAASTGNVFLEGALSGELTIGSINNIYITDDITYNNDSSDMLGLIADNYVYINHYNQSGSDVAPSNVTIKAAVFALKHSFGYESYTQGPPKGTIHLTGCIIQKYRGPVGQFSGHSVIHGYSKDYRYDERMIFSEPPHFLEPLNSGFEIAKWVEV